MPTDRTSCNPLESPARSASTPSPDALSLLLERDDTDVDLQNRLDRFTPLHLAVRLEHEEARAGVTEMLLDAGADPRCGLAFHLSSLLDGGSRPYFSSLRRRWSIQD